MSPPLVADKQRAENVPLGSRELRSGARDLTRMERGLWLLSLALTALAGGLWAGFAPLADPDLPMHLAVGEWIAAHHTVPYVEPFAWTRSGAPYYAYSWLAQLPFYEILRAFGPTGLHLLGVVMGATTVLAGAIVGRAFGLRGVAPVLFGALNVFVASESTPFLRPQLIMHVLVPLAWACSAALMESRGARRAALLAALMILSAVAANVHITFLVLAAVAVVPLVAVRRTSFATFGAALLSVLAGWLISPYALVWPELLRLNLGPNAITSGMSPAGELAPGFAVAPVVGLALGALPFFARVDALASGKRALLGGLWLAGLLVFGRYFKGLGPWWWCSIPLVAAALLRLPMPSTERAARSFAVLIPSVVFACAITNVRLYAAVRGLEGGVQSRVLPSIKGYAAEPAARWLTEHLSPTASGHLLTVFNYGSYLRWRVPNLSESIDTRGIFPDSAALPDVPTINERSHPGPWRSAVVAIVPVTYPSAHLLDADPAWLRVGIADAAPWAPNAPRAGLWVQREWFAKNSKPGTIIPKTPLMLGARDPGAP